MGFSYTTTKSYVVDMILLVASKLDPASMNIRDRLLELREWSLRQELGLKADSRNDFDGSPVHTFNDFIMVTINSRALEYDYIDREVRNILNIDGPEAVIYLSKHRSASGRKSLTVHPIGNYGTSPEYGGRPKTVVMSSPRLMTAAFRTLDNNAKAEALDFAVSFEATHHGPYLETPTFFIEIGSDESVWTDKAAGNTLARTILELPEYISREQKDRTLTPIAIGVGGGHYAPRHSDVARKTKVAFGHIIPSYAVDAIMKDGLDGANEFLSEVLSKTPDASVVYFHRKALRKSTARSLGGWFDERGIKTVREKDLVIV